MLKNKKYIIFLLSIVYTLIVVAVPAPAPVHAEEENHDIFTFKIESDNPYFPDMTIPQIQEWYTKEVTAFIESGQTDKKLEEFQEDVTMWADWITRKREGTLQLHYDVWVKSYDEVNETKEFYLVQKRIYDFLRNYYEENGKTLNFNRWTYDDITPEPTKPVESPHGEEENHDFFTFKIESDNPYFPDMTIPQIQEWYTKEVTAFIESGQTDKKLEEFQEDVTAWSGYVTRNNASGLSIVYRADVERYGKQDETRDFYEVQKKMYDFLRDYYEKDGKALNFKRWTYDDMPEPTKEVTPELSATPEPTKEATPVLSATPEPEPTKETTPVLSATPEPEPTKETTPVLSATSEPEPKKENGFIAVLKKAWFVLLILGIILVGGIIWKSKYKNKDN